MLTSMTGFGTATVEANGLSATAEVKTLNSKFLDIFCRLPRGFSDREIEVRNLLTQRLERGKVEFNLSVTRTADVRPAVTVNRPLIQAYINDLTQSARELRREVSDETIFKMALTMPNAYLSESSSQTDTAQEDWATVQEAIHQAIAGCQEFRRQEGASLESKLTEYIQNIAARLVDVEAQDAERIPAVRERMRAGVTELLGNEDFDRNRFEQELVYYVEKLDISEEKVRLKNHLSYFTEVLESAEANGKKLNFIAQEIGREINTIGSKANDATVQRFVVQMKDELEKIKEQTLNVI